MFYKFLNESEESLHFIMSSSYLKDGQYFTLDQRWEIEAATLKSLGYKIPNETVMARHCYSHLKDSVFSELLSVSGNNPIFAFKRFLTERLPFLEVEFQKILSNDDFRNIEVILSCSNCPSLEAVAKKLNIPVVHFELGPLRAPNYLSTAYFDFTGVNGNTEAEKRYLEVADTFGDDLLLVEDVRNFFTSCNEYVASESPKYGVGVPLQVEDDSNLIAFSNGYDNSSLIAYSKLLYGRDFVVRTHPNSMFFCHGRDLELDGSVNSSEFISGCREVVTINSSIGLEALLFERKVTVLGDSSFSFLTNAGDQEKAKRIAFYAFSYLVPFSEVFSPDYIRFRLKRPSELEILKWHMNVYGYASVEHGSMAKIIKSGLVRHTMNKMAQANEKMREQINRLELENEQSVYERQKLLEENKQLLCSANQQFEKAVLLDKVLASVSWKVTKPLRYSRQLATSFVQAFTVHALQIRQAVQMIRSDPKVLLRATNYIRNNGFKDAANQVVRLLGDNYSTQTSLANFDNNAVAFVLTTKHCMFVAELIKSNMEKVGFSVDIIFDVPAFGFDSSLHFVICPQMFSKLPDRYIAFQMEQSVSSRWFEEGYLQTLKKAHAILDYSLVNISFLQGKGIDFKKLYYVPISFAHTVREPRLTTKEYDVLFYGDVNNERRLCYLEVLEAKYKVKVISGLFGDELYREIDKAKVVVNIHYYEGALLETTRIYECLSRGGLIVSESSSDIVEHTCLEGIVDFVEVGNVQAMVERIDHWLSDENLRQDKVASIKAGLLAVPDFFEYYFQRFLLANDIIDFDKFYDVAADNINFQSEFICLGLPESIERRKNFEKDNKVGFQYFPGLRHSLGWVGCGLSYKFILRKACEQAFKKLTVCEDDVEFFDGWKERFDRIQEYLATQQDNSWDIFSGLIANLHTDTDVKATKLVDELELIYINKMTSTVLNTYNSSVFSKVIKWDENFRDPYENTIDRFIESQDDINVVTTSPFIVGHKEELTSTLWGFQNTQYKDMIAASESLLKEKLQAFKQKKISDTTPSA
nr:hypothetical protein FFPRI1PSEUD_24440 [Pseudomonas sp. FFPRI_1]